MDKCTSGVCLFADMINMFGKVELRIDDHAYLSGTLSRDTFTLEVPVVIQLMAEICIIPRY